MVLRTLSLALSAVKDTSAHDGESADGAGKPLCSLSILSLPGFGWRNSVVLDSSSVSSVLITSTLWKSNTAQRVSQC